MADEFTLMQVQSHTSSIGSSKKAISRENKLLELITVMEDIVGFQNGQYEI